jgi:DNA-binding IclR family transcriptional regulator
MQKKSNYKPLVPAVEHASKVLLCLGAGDKFNKRLTEICKQVGIHKSKAYTILNTLMKFGFVEKDSQMKTYSLGPGLVLLSRYFLDNLHYMQVVSPFIAALARETKITALFGMISGGYVFILDKYEVNQNVSFTLRIGHRLHITLGSIGKSIVAFMPDEKREEILARKKLYFHGDPASLDLKQLRNELEECRRKWYATSDIGEITPGISAVSAPVFGPNKKVIGCVTLLGAFPSNMAEELGAKTSYTGRQISRRLGADLKGLYIVQS